MTKEKKNMPKVPNLRFPGFEGEWENKKIGDILKIGSGKDYKHLEKGNIPVYGTGGYMTSVNDFLYERESVCIGRKGTINKPMYLNEKFWTVDTLFYTHSYKDILPKFVYYIFEQINWLKYNEASGVPSLSKSTIKQIDVNRPNIKEQKQIVKFISLLDEKIQTQIKTIEHLETLIKGVSKKLFSQELRFTGFDDNWEVRKLKELCQVTKGKQLNREKLTKKGKYPCQNGGILPSGYTDKFNSEADSITISEGGNSCGYVNFIKTKFWLGGHCYKVTPLVNINKVYLYFLLKHNENLIMRLRVGSGLPNIQIKSIKKYKICISKSLEEQTKIASFLSSIDEKIETEKAILEQLENQKKYFLQNLFV